MQSVSLSRRRRHAQRGATTRSVLVLLALVVLGFVGYQIANPHYEPCALCEHTGHLSCGAEGCEYGRVECTNNCIKADDHRWARVAVEGHPPDEEWIRFYNADGSYAAWTRAHIGELVERVNGTWVNRGRCPTCNGTTRMACPNCNGARACPRCRGQGQRRRWFSMR